MLLTHVDTVSKVLVFNFKICLFYVAFITTNYMICFVYVEYLVNSKPTGQLYFQLIAYRNILIYVIVCNFECVSMVLIG